MRAACWPPAIAPPSFSDLLSGARVIGRCLAVGPLCPRVPFETFACLHALLFSPPPKDCEVTALGRPAEPPLMEVALVSLWHAKTQETSRVAWMGLTFARMESLAGAPGVHYGGASVQGRWVLCLGAFDGAGEAETRGGIQTFTAPQLESKHVNS